MYSLFDSLLALFQLIFLKKLINKYQLWSVYFNHKHINMKIYQTLSWRISNIFLVTNLIRNLIITPLLISL